MFTLKMSRVILPQAKNLIPIIKLFSVSLAHKIKRAQLSSLMLCQWMDKLTSCLTLWILTIQSIISRYKNHRQMIRIPSLSHFLQSQAHLLCLPLPHVIPVKKNMKMMSRWRLNGYDKLLSNMELAARRVQVMATLQSSNNNHLCQKRLMSRKRMCYNHQSPMYDPTFPSLERGKRLLAWSLIQKGTRKRLNACSRAKLVPA